MTVSWKNRILSSARVFAVLISVTACFQKKPSYTETLKKGTYDYDQAFLQTHLSDLQELSNENGARVLVTGDFQGRVMTSTTGSATGTSFGWINYALIEKTEKNDQFNPVGGEERFWIGPEGGQFSFYFPQNKTFEFSNWKVPAFIDTEPFTLKSSAPNHAVYTRRASLENYSGIKFELDITRSVLLMGAADLAHRLGTEIPDQVKWVAYETSNEIKNAGSNAWSKEQGLLSIWLLGMFTPSPETVSIIPFRKGQGYEKLITDNYFGRIPSDRLVTKDSVLLLKCDGKLRSKLGLSPQIAKPMAGSYDFEKNTLTLILFQVDNEGDYVNSKWEIQDNPYEGDAVNAYNDGPLQDGSIMGPFYELESSSPARALAPGAILTYKQVTCHFEGDYASLDALARKTLGISLEEARLP